MIFSISWGSVEFASAGVVDRKLRATNELATVFFIGLLSNDVSKDLGLVYQEENVCGANFWWT